MVWASRDQVGITASRFFSSSGHFLLQTVCFPLHFWQGSEILQKSNITLILRRTQIRASIRRNRGRRRNWHILEKMEDQPKHVLNKHNMISWLSSRVEKEHEGLQKSKHSLRCCWQHDACPLLFPLIYYGSLTRRAENTTTQCISTVHFSGQ